MRLLKDDQENTIRVKRNHKQFTTHVTQATLAKLWLRENFTQREQCIHYWTNKSMFRFLRKLPTPTTLATEWKMAMVSKHETKLFGRASNTGRLGSLRNKRAVDFQPNSCKKLWDKLSKKAKIENRWVKNWMDDPLEKQVTRDNIVGLI